MTIGENIKNRRKNIGLNREELAEKAGISVSHLAKLERDEQKNPTIQYITAISTALNCSIDELVFNENSNNTAYITKLIEQLNELDKEYITRTVKGLLMISRADEISDTHKSKQQ